MIFTSPKKYLKNIEDMINHPLTDSDSQALKVIIRKNLQALHDFCEENNLVYYLSDGTLLGAIRHGGMIPWDDDADVCMPREDYNKLIALSDKLPKPYSLRHFTITPGYIYPIAKLVDTTTEIQEFYGADSYSDGAWVDIFPLDGTYSNKLTRRFHYAATKILRYFFEIKARKIRKIQKPTDTRAITTIKYIAKSLILYFSKLLSNNTPAALMDKVARHKKYNSSKIAGNLYTGIGIRASHSKEIFASREKHSFDNFALYIPIGYDQYLTNLYGDYMTPPPPNSRSAHNIRVINLPAEES
ncbi:LicD family protein [compost metagenome]